MIEPKDLKGRFVKGIKGEFKHNWKGENVGYYALHNWIKRELGEPQMCSFNPLHKSSKFEWANISGKYLRDTADYMALCGSCHKRMDWGTECAKGHAYTKENTYWFKGTRRKCKTCQREYARIYQAKKKGV